MTIFYEDERVIAIATDNSKNSKTGGMIQSWLLLKNYKPQESFRAGKDDVDQVTPHSEICGNCPHLLNGSCYVLWHQAPLQVYKKWRRGGYKFDNPNKLGKSFRFGSAGNPTILPLPVVSEIAKNSKTWTGYTHEWKLAKKQEYRKYFMASVDNTQEAQQAKELGWRYFRVRKPGDDTLLPGEIHCPAQKYPDKVTCESCGLCNGTSNKSHVNIVVDAHGARKTNIK